MVLDYNPVRREVKSAVCMPAPQGRRRRWLASVGGLAESPRPVSREFSAITPCALDPLIPRPPRLLYPVFPFFALDHWTTRPLDHSPPLDFRPGPTMLLTMNADVRLALTYIGVK